ncbi:hypothetical protein [Nonomuraea soli]|uniref:Meckel syndrome type 1 protein n=1 Tax=Nonomuraea soli TaxID=1032476 RepID=A0A7W0CNF7_9ACTN|nr:hypothetical protein [Nonomuraea soli]MBA2894387.1 Meckel syndrome type 1 protein [Nonomuraea soli]
MILVAVVLLVLVVVALGMRSMNKRESSLPPERMKELIDREERTQIRSTDEFAAHEPRMSNFSPDFSPIDEDKPKPVRTGQRGKRGVDEWGNPSSDDEDEEFWASIRSDAAEGGFGASGTVKPRQASTRPRETVSDDANATTVQAPLPQRPVERPVARPAAAAASLGSLVDQPKNDVADQRTVTFAAPTPDVMSILGPGSKSVPSTHTGAHPAAAGSGPSTGSFQPVSAASTGSFPAATTSGSFPAASASGSFPAVSQSGSFPAVNASGSFPAVNGGAARSAPTSDPFPAYGNDALETTWQQPLPGTASGSWPAASHDVLDDPAPAGGSWPAFEGGYTNGTYSYEVGPGYAAPDGDALTGPSPAVGTPTAPSRAVSAYDDVLSPPAYERAGYTTPGAPASPAAWPEPPANTWPTYGEMYGSQQQQEAGAGRRGGDQDYNDYYR